MTPKHFIALAFILFASIFTNAQSHFENGYFISNKGEKIECLIKNLNWLDSPKEVFYKLTSEGDVKSFDTSMVSEFKVENGPIYLKVTDEFPQTKQYLNEKGINKEPKMLSKSVYVKKVLDGPASLFVYKADNDKVFLLQIDSNNPFPLIYKEYVRAGSNDILSNNIYRRQLLQYLDCGQNENIQTVSYSEKSLKSYLIWYNKCIHPDFQSEEGINSEKKIKVDTRFLITAGIASYAFNTEFYGTDVSFENKIVPVLGFEVESIFPFNNRKWSVFLSSHYMSYKSAGMAVVNSVSVRAANIELSQINTNIGARHYLFLNDSLSIYFQVGSSIDYNFNTSLETQPGFQTIFDDISPMTFGGFAGSGLSINQKYYFNIKYLIGTSILRNDLDNPNNLKRFVFSASIKL